MHVLIATDSTPAHERRPMRSARPDVGAAVDGELVAPVVVDCPDAHCATCATGWFGLVSHGASSTAMVVDRPGVTESDLKRRIHDWLDCIGVVDAIVQSVEAGDHAVDGCAVDDPVAAVDDVVMAHVHDIRRICERFPLGTELSRMGQLVAPVRGVMAA